MNLFRSVGIFGSLVLAILTGCSTAARDASNDDAPVAQVTLSSADQPARVGTVLQGSYQYSDPDGDGEKDSLKAWLRDGQPIDGANQNEYTASVQDSGKKLQFQVTPAAASGTSPGAAAASSSITIENSAPVMTLTNPLVGTAAGKTAGIGNLLRVDFSYSDADGDAAASPEIRWLRDGTVLPTVTSATYTVTLADLDSYLAAEVTPVASQGVVRGTTIKSDAVFVTNSVPVAQNVALTADTTPAVIGSVLSARYTYFDADENPEISGGSTVQWLRNGTVVPDATALTYTLTAPADADATFRVTITPKSSVGTSPGSPVESNPVTVTNSTPRASNTVISGSGVVGGVLSASYSYSDLDQNTQGASVYRWYRGEILIPGATSLSYKITVADIDNDLSFEVTPVATQGASPGVALRSNAIRVTNSAPVATDVTLSANATPPVVGSVLTASYAYGDADGDAESASLIRWLRNGTEINGVQGLSYTLTAADSSSTVTFEITPRAKTGSSPGSAVKSNGIVVGNSAPTVTGVSITPATAQVATLLITSYAYNDADNNLEGTSLYEWRNGTAVIGTAKTYTVKAADAHKTLTVKVTPVASAGSSPGLPVTSPGLTVANSAPSITGLVIGGSVAGKFYLGLTLTASYAFQDADGDGEGAPAYQWLRNGIALGGAITPTYLVSRDDVGQLLTVQVTPKDNFIPALSGTPMTSPAITPVNLAPVVSNVVVSGKAVNQAGEVLSVTYTRSDKEDDLEPATGSAIQWLRNNTAIVGTSRVTYPLTLADAGQTITAQVTPLSQTGASPGLPVVSNSVVVQPANVALNVSAGLKQLRFSWAAVPGASTYRVSHRPTEGAGFVPVSTASDKLTTTNYDWDISVHHINWPTAQFMLEACDSSGCVPSASISALNVMLGAIGYFKASNTGANDKFGDSVALSADGLTLAVGAYDEDSANINGNPADDCRAASPANCAANSGAVYVFILSGAAWSQQAYVKASDPVSGDQFGYSVALSADGLTLAVGAYGEDSANINGNPVDDCRAASPANCAISSGAVYVYARSGTTWSQQAYVKASNAGASDVFGYSVALSGDGLTLAVGAKGEDSANVNGNPVDDCNAATSPANCALNSGAVYVYARSGTAWSQRAYVKTSNPSAWYNFGHVVALNGDGLTLAVVGGGAAYVYTRSGAATWSQQAYLKAANPGANFYSLALSADGNTLAVGAVGEDSANINGNPVDDCNATSPANCAIDSGAVYVYAHSGAATWSQQAYVKASNPGSGDNFGDSVALSADGFTLAVGAANEDGARSGVTPGAPGEAAVPDGALTTSSSSGAVYVYVYAPSSAAWSQQAYVKASNTEFNENFGTSLALSGDGAALAVGAWGESSAATGVNNTVPGQSDNSAVYAGAVYMY